MNPGAMEHGAEAAKETVSALKGYPALLTLVVFNILFMAAVAYAMHERAAAAAEQFKLVVQQCGPRQ